MMNGKKATSIIEYTILIVIMALALISSVFYLKRANQGRLKKSADTLGVQFSPGYSNLLKRSSSYSHTQETLEFNGERKEELQETEYSKTNFSDDFSEKSLKGEELWQ